MSTLLPRSMRAHALGERNVDARKATAWTSSTADLLRFERMLANLSARFINLPPAEVDSEVEEALRLIVETIDLDRSILFRFHPEENSFVSTHSWTRSEFPAARSGDLSRWFPWAIAKFKRGELVKFSSIDELPPEASIDKASWFQNGCRSHVSVPLRAGGKIEGALTFAMFRREREWPEHLLSRLRLIAEILGNALARKRSHEELEKLLAFEQMHAEIAASMVSVPPADVDIAIEAGLQRTARFLDVERVTLWSLAADRKSLRSTHFWTAEDAPAPPKVSGSNTPWLVAQLTGGSVVRLCHVDELPPQADADIATLRALGTVSMLAIPLRIAGVVVGAFSLATIRAAREWPDAVVPRVRLLGEVFANALARRQSESRVYAAQAEAAQHRERLAHLVRLHTVGEMSAGIAHEINQPLVAIENYALAARRYASVEDRADMTKVVELLDKIVAQSSRAGDVIKHLRAMVKRHEFEMTPVDIRLVVTDSLRFAEMEGQLREVSIELQLSEELPTVVADTIQIQQVILNLVRNAIESMGCLPHPQAKVLTIAVGLEDDQNVFVRIDDCGPGFATGDVERIFEPFFSTKSSGLGIGLSLCRTIVEAHGGRLWAWPAPEGGAVFKFTLPCAEETG
jgi:signal transduction histidine kinase